MPALRQSRSFPHTIDHPESRHSYWRCMTQKMAFTCLFALNGCKRGFMGSSRTDARAQRFTRAYWHLVRY